MSTVLLFLAIAVAVIIFSIALQIIFKNPFLVAAIVFAIFLIVAAVVGTIEWLIATIIFTILAFVTALLTCLICKICSRLGDVSDNTCGICCNNNDNNGNETAVEGITQDDIQDLTRALNNFTNCCCRRRR